MYESDQNTNTSGIRVDRIIMVLLLVAALGAGAFFFWQYRTTQEQLTLLKKTTAQSQSIADRKQQILAEVSQIAELPTGEEPTLVTINDIDTLAGQPFFVNAHNGDEVLVYKQSKRAVIYNPTTKKIVDMAQVNLDAQPEASASADQK